MENNQISTTMQAAVMRSVTIMIRRRETRSATAPAIGLKMAAGSMAITPAVARAAAEPVARVIHQTSTNWGQGTTDHGDILTCKDREETRLPVGVGDVFDRHVLLRLVFVDQE